MHKFNSIRVEVQNGKHVHLRQKCNSTTAIKTNCVTLILSVWRSACALWSHSIWVWSENAKHSGIQTPCIHPSMALHRMSIDSACNNASNSIARYGVWHYWPGDWSVQLCKFLPGQVLPCARHAVSVLLETDISPSSRRGPPANVRNKHLQHSMGNNYL